MNAGALRHQVEIQEVVDVQEQSGGTRPGDGPVRPWAASIEPLSQRELLQTAQTESRATTRIRIRWFDGLTNKHRIIWRDRGRLRTFNIESVIDVDEAHVEQVLLCVEAG